MNRLGIRRSLVVAAALAIGLVLSGSTSGAMAAPADAGIGHHHHHHPVYHHHHH